MTSDRSWNTSALSAFMAGPAGQPTRDGQAASELAPDNPEPVLPMPEDWADPLSGTSGPRAWQDLLRREQARMRRYKRTACVVFVDLTGFDEAATWLGADMVRQHFARVSRTLAKEVRASDYVTRIDRHRFGILLVETDEILAINFVDRLRAACRLELGSAGMGFGIRIGWASPPPGGALAEALVTAEERLADDPFA